MADTIVLCIPGPWMDQGAFLSALVASGDGIAAGKILMSSATKASCGWEFQGPDARIADAFRVSLMPDEAEDVPQKIAAHGSVVYLIEPKEQGEAAVRRMIDLAMPCLDAGGLGVKVEVAGKAFSAQKWRALSDNPMAHYEQMVLHMVAEKDGYFSCGMHQYGYPDTFVETADFQEAVDVARSLERFQIYETPELGSGHTFSTEAGAPVWRLDHAKHPYHDDEFLDRSLGVWRLSKVTAH